MQPSPNPMTEENVVIPVSAGIPPVVRWTTFVCLLMIFAVIAIAVGTSNYHHMWPTLDTTRIKL
jgi:hypothetical protein